MKRPFVVASLILATLGLASSGCSQTGSKSMASKSSKPADPTSWTDKEVANDNASSSSSLPKSSRLTGGWSDDAREIEKSLGVGR